MGRCYGQITYEERQRIAELRRAGGSTRQIATAPDRSSSAIADELKRNARADGGYDAEYAQERTWARRFRGSRLEREDALRERVTGLLERGLSPEQAAGRLNREAGGTVLCHETIYRFIYAQVARTKDYRWGRLLPSGRTRRRKRGQRRPRGGGGPVGFIRDRRPLSERPIEAQTRAAPGHWEADLMQFGRGRPALLVLQERCTRAVLAAPLPNKASAPLIEALAALLGALPAALRRSVSFDNGAEFVRHRELHALGVETFFCEPHAPWQKGGVENAIGRLRRFPPRSTDLAALPRRALNGLLLAVNNLPRKCLGCQSPAEVLQAQLSGLQSESAFLPAQE